MKRTSYILYFIGCVIIITILQGLFIYKLYVNTETEIGNNAIILSKAVANAIDVDKYEVIAEKNLRNDYFIKMQNYFHKTQLDAKVKYLYVSRYLSDKQIEYIFDGSGDSLGQRDNTPHPYVYKTTKSTLEKLTYYHQWGTLITGNAPLINKQGKVVGVVGVDVDISDFNKLLFSKEKPAYILSFALMLILLLTLSVFLRLAYLQKIELIKLYKKSFDMLSMSLSKKSSYTLKHSENVSAYTEILAKEMGFHDKEIQIISWAAILHDIGKIGIPDELLDKPGALSLEEFEEIKKHTHYSREILSQIFQDSTSFLDLKEYKIIMDIVSYHHERWDGRGYPYHLKGTEIPLTARILSLADSLEAMMAERPYKKPLSEDQILKEITSNSGKQFDPQVVKAFMHCYEKNLIKLDTEEKEG